MARFENNHWKTLQSPDEEDPRKLIVELCKQFYHLGWVTGTGGGMTIKKGLTDQEKNVKLSPKRKAASGSEKQEEFAERQEEFTERDDIFIAPSGVQKERMKEDDLFVQTIKGDDLCLPPPAKKLKKSQCTPLFMKAYTLRDAGAVIHSHSRAAVMATLICPGTEFKITHQEMIKGIKKCQSGTYYRYDEELVVPIIENTPFESDLMCLHPDDSSGLLCHRFFYYKMGEYWFGNNTQFFPVDYKQNALAQAIEDYPDSCAVLVRRHGVYVWGENWQKCKTMCECYDYLFDIAVQMKSIGFDPAAVPTVPKGAYVSTVTK